MTIASELAIYSEFAIGYTTSRIHTVGTTKSSSHILCIGVNTGNSLDAADVVLTRFGTDESIEDLTAHTKPLSSELVSGLRLLRGIIVNSSGEMNKACRHFAENCQSTDLPFKSADELINAYTLFVSEAVKELIEKSKDFLEPGSSIDLIGFHGQTCAHQPPSAVKDPSQTYTVQIGDGQLLANETGIAVVYDFRSDDLMNGGEGAPLAPLHHDHVARQLKSQGKFPIAFCNAGNTGNITVITERADGKQIVLGWDTGPFNEFPDRLASDRELTCDMNGKIGAKGQVRTDLLRLLFDQSVRTASGDNYLLKPPPKSSDPQWYLLPVEIAGYADDLYTLEDRMRTVEYFAAYAFFYSLKWIADDTAIPKCYALAGGGWNNPIPREHFAGLLRGDFTSNPVLDGHKELFVRIHRRLAEAPGQVEIDFSDRFGFSGQFMEARLFADAAVSRIRGIPFSRPETTGCRTPTVLGIIRFPQADIANASKNLMHWLKEHDSVHLTLDKPAVFDGRWSRASASWSTK
jgi:anhydro-N-acetylmuramic acid kinase